MGKLYQTAIEIGAKISKSFKGDTLAAAGALHKLHGAAKQLHSAEKAAGAVKKLNAAVASSKSKYDQASAALRQLETAERAAGGATKESTAWRKAGEKEVAKYAKEVDRATVAAERNAKALRSIPHARYEVARERLFGERKEKHHEPLLAQGKEQFKSVGESILHLAEVGLVAGETLHLLAERTIAAGANIGETAEKLGIGARALQELRYGAQQSGAQVEDLDRALSKMAINIGKSKATGGKAGGLLLGGMQMLDTKAGEAAAGKLDPFKRIGLNAKQLAGLKPEEQLKKIADGMLKLKTHADKAAVAQAIFGKGATQILPYLSEGAEGIEKLSKQANQYGGVLSNESVEAAIVAEKASKDMKLAISGVTNTIGAALLPVATKAFKAISAWARDNREQIKKWAENTAKWIEQKAIPAFFKIAGEIKSVASKVLTLVDALGIGNVAIGATVLRLAPLSLTLVKIGWQGLKAADALIKIGRATNAMNAMSTVTGFSPAFLSAAVPLGAIAIAATAVGVAIWRIVDAVKELGGTGAVWNDIKDFVAHKPPAVEGKQNAAAFAEMQAQNERNLALARMRRAASGDGAAPSASTPGGGVSVPTTISIVGMDNLSGKIDEAHAKQKATIIETVERHNAQRRRVAFAE